jgi:POT family proton-dependent oligopeptide transporter
MAESKLGPWLYDVYASKDQFSRDLLAQLGVGDVSPAAIPQGEAFQYLVKHTGRDPFELTRQLYESHNVSMVWDIMAIVGILSAIGIWLYGRWIRELARKEA